MLDDAPAIFAAYAADADVTRYLTWTAHTSVETVRQFLEGVLARGRTGEEHAWVLTAPGTGQPLGMISARVRGHKADIGYVLARAHWGQGYMTEAIVAVTRWLLDQPGIFRVWAVCDIENVGSARALEKSGFEREGILRRWIMHPNLVPAPRDCLVYARVR